NMDGAGERLPLLISRFPDNLRVRQLELEYEMRTAPREVEGHLESVLAAYPDLRSLRIRLLEWQVTQGAFLAAEDYARRAIAVDEVDDETRLRLAMLLIRTDRGPEGLGHVRRYLDSNEGNGKAWLLLGEGLAMQQQMAEADEAMEKAIRLDSSPMVLKQVMLHYRNSGRAQRAAELMERLRIPSGR
ncbi:MAG: hypothetical protein P8I74_05585, partial [Phycisphaerales bacterium]|nr:hypothetical protein [Phycisphaerales bacterium]